MDFFDVAVQTLDSTIRLSVPLLLACLAGLYSERSGIFDIGLEGKMLAGAFASAAAASVFHSAWIGLGMGILISVALGMYALHALSRIREGEEVSERVVMQQFALEALRTVNQLSTVAGLLGNLFAFNRLIERRLSGRRNAEKASTGASADAPTGSSRPNAPPAALMPESAVERRTTPDRRTPN